MNQKYNLGKKIKDARLSLGMTQSALCGDKITRNMLSLIESGNATPSLETADFLAKELKIPLAYLFSEENDLNYFKKKQSIDYIKDLFKRKNYEHCIKIIDNTGAEDDEINYIYAISAYELGKTMLKHGSFLSANKYLTCALIMAKRTVYDTEKLLTNIPMYLSIISNVQSPLLEFDSDAFENKYSNSNDFEFFKYLTQDLDFEFKNEIYRDHIEAKICLKKYNYIKAIEILVSMEKYKSSEKYDAFVMFGAYTDLEMAYKQVGDFENAYRYANKRLSLLNAFQS